MITFFTIPRAFTGEFNGLQRRAIESWREAVPGAQVILMGSEPGTYQAAGRLRCDHVLELSYNAQGTPLVSSAFRLAETLGHFDLRCEISSDIVLCADFVRAMQVVDLVDRPFVVGQRYDLAEDGGLTLHPPSGIDYFVYRRGTLGEIPPFAVGRTAYDNWLVWAAIEQWGLTTIDATADITALHIAHGYPPWDNGKRGMLDGQERIENHRLMQASGCPRFYGVTDAPYVLRDGEVRPRD